MNSKNVKAFNTRRGTETKFIFKKTITIRSHSDQKLHKSCLQQKIKVV